MHDHQNHGYLPEYIGVIISTKNLGRYIYIFIQFKLPTYKTNSGRVQAVAQKVRLNSPSLSWKVKVFPTISAINWGKSLSTRAFTPTPIRQDFFKLKMLYS